MKDERQKNIPKTGKGGKRGTEKRGCQPLRERLAAAEMISGFVDDAPSGDGLEHESVSMDSGGTVSGFPESCTKSA